MLYYQLEQVTRVNETKIPQNHSVSTCPFKSSALHSSPAISACRSFPTLVSDTSRGESRACLFCQ